MDSDRVSVVGSLESRRHTWHQTQRGRKSCQFLYYVCLMAPSILRRAPGRLQKMNEHVSTKVLCLYIYKLHLQMYTFVYLMRREIWNGSFLASVFHGSFAALPVCGLSVSYVCSQKKRFRETRIRKYTVRCRWDYWCCDPTTSHIHTHTHIHTYTHTQTHMLFELEQLSFVLCDKKRSPHDRHYWRHTHTHTII